MASLVAPLIVVGPPDFGDAAGAQSVTLAASAVTHDSATLTISGHSTDWYYEYTTPTGGQCSSTAVTTTSTDLTGLDPATGYVYVAYSDSGCTTVLATAARFITLAAPDSGGEVEAQSVTLSSSAVTHNSATLTISGHSTDWYYKYTTPTGGQCSSTAVSTTTKDLTGLDPATGYVYVAYSDSGCITVLATAAQFTTLAAPTLAASDITHSTATLTISNWSNDWYYQTTGRACSSAVKTATAGLTNLNVSTAYVYKAYSDSGCATELATAASFTTKAAAPSLAASAVTHNSATLTISNWDEAWYYKYTAPTGGTCSSTAVAAGTSTANLTTLSGSTSYTFKAYRDSGCATELATAAAFTSLATPTLVGSAIGMTTGSLTISNWDEAWYYKDTTGTCSTVVAANTLTASLTTLTAGTSYTYSAYSDSGCNTLLATASAFTTYSAAPALASSAITSAGAVLTISNWGGSGITRPPPADNARRLSRPGSIAPS